MSPASKIIDWKLIYLFKKKSRINTSESVTHEIKS